MASSSNPSHILMARTPNGPSLSSPTENHTAAVGIFPRSLSSPSWILDESSSGAEDVYDHVESGIEDGEVIEVDPTFRKGAEWPGSVKINVENTTFWAHKDVLIFASPFFAAALSGNWAETGRPESLSSSVITVTQSPTPPLSPSPLLAPSTAINNSDPTRTTTNPPSIPSTPTGGDWAVLPTTLPIPLPPSPAPPSPPPLTSFRFLSPSPSPDSVFCDLLNSSEDEEEVHRAASLRILSGGPQSPPSTPGVDALPSEILAAGSGLGDNSRKGRRSVRVSWDGRAGKKKGKRRAGSPEAVIDLKEEKASAFHDFLKFVYPHLECTITWNNVENLMHLAQKLISPNLQAACLNFLLSHAAGKPIKAMRIAEMYEEEELFREASRFVLDNLGGWPDAELKTLSRETLLKLEKRRTWFLERLLKLGVTPIAKDYTCCSTCPDPTVCARLLEEKWRQGYLSLLRFGPPQPSMVFRYLRQLELSPPLTLTHLSCQTCAKTYISTLFDRMFSLGVRGSGTDTTPLGARVASGILGPRRHFLYCSLRPDREWKPNSSTRRRQDSDSRQVRVRASEDG